MRAVQRRAHCRKFATTHPNEYGTNFSLPRDSTPKPQHIALSP